MNYISITNLKPESCCKPDVIKKRFRNPTTRTREGKGKMGREENYSRLLFGKNRESKLQLHTVLKLMTVKKKIVSVVRVFQVLFK